MTTTEIRLEMTCGACPEQYDAFVGSRQVGYLRLRHGYFRVDFPDCGGQTIYEAATLGDGVFDESERDHHIQRAKDAIAAKLAQGPHSWQYAVRADLLVRADASLT